MLQYLIIDFFLDNERLWSTKCRIKLIKKTKIRLRLFYYAIAGLIDNQWEQIQVLPFAIKEY